MHRYRGDFGKTKIDYEIGDETTNCYLRQTILAAEVFPNRFADQRANLLFPFRDLFLKYNFQLFILGIVFAL